MNIYVGNLSFDTTDTELRAEFEAFGAVSRVSTIMDRETGRSRGFAFVEMPQDTEGRAAIDGLNGRALGGRNLAVSEARQRAENGARRRS